MSYHFKLEALRRLRRFQEETLQKELADLQRIQEQAAAILDQSMTLRDKAEADLKQVQTDPTTGTQVNLYLRFLQRLSGQINTQKNTLTTAEKACREKRAALLAVVKKRKMLEKLKEKELKTYLTQLDREEQKFINEMAINRFTLNKR